MKLLILLLTVLTLCACLKSSIDPYEDMEPLISFGDDDSIPDPIPGYGHGYFTVSFNQEASDSMAYLLSNYNYPKELNFMANGIVIATRVAEQSEDDPSCTTPGNAVIVKALFNGEQHQPITYLDVIDENNDTLWHFEEVAKRDYCIKVLFKKENMYQI